MTEGTITLTDDSANSGPVLATAQKTGGKHVHRMCVESQGEDGLAAEVTDAPPAPSDPGLVVRLVDVTTTATLSRPAAATNSAVILASNTNRLAASIYNDADKTLYVSLGTNASTTNFTVPVAPGGYYELDRPVYTGNLYGIWAAGVTGAAQVTERS